MTCGFGGQWDYQQDDWMTGSHMMDTIADSLVNRWAEGQLPSARKYILVNLSLAGVFFQPNYLTNENKETMFVFIFKLFT